MFDESFICKDAGLRESVHPLAYFDKDVVVVDQRSEVILFHDAVRNVLYRDSHVLKTVHWCVEIKVFDVHGEESSVKHGDNTVEE
jgi:hypothetical protein